MRCKVCGAEINENSKFCLNCGTEVLHDHREKSCPNCGTQNDEDSEFCKSCGYAFNSQNYYPDDYEGVQSRTSTGMIVIICLLAVAIFAAIIFMIFQFANNNKTEKQTKTATKTVESTENQTQTQQQQPVTTTPAQTPTQVPSTPAVDSDDYGGSSSSTPSYSQTTPSSGSSVSSSGEYIFPDSNSRYLSRSELVNLSEDELCIARNEISARHGRRFNTDWIQNYFNTKSWYNPTYGPEEFDSMEGSLMTDLERSNMETIKAYEQEMGYL